MTITAKKVLLFLTCLVPGSFLISGCGSGSSTMTPPPTITVALAAKRAALVAAQGLPVAATTNDAAGVTWSATGGTFSSDTSLNGASVTYTAPATGGTYTLKATSVTSASTTAAMTVYVTDLVGVTTYHNDVARDGVNGQEYALTPATVTAATFGKLFGCNVDGAIYAQPLWLPNVTVAGVKHNAVFVATMHDSLYAFDADASTCTQLWKASMTDATHGANAGELAVRSVAPGNQVGVGYGDIAPEVGITGTPVIDPATGTLYLISKTVSADGATFYQRLHAIDITSGVEKLGGPVGIDGSISVPGTGSGGTTVSFNTQFQAQRPGLALVNGVIYVAWGSHEDNVPYYGWVMSFKASDLSRLGVLNVTPNVQFGGIWMGGGAPSADSDGNLYLITGNGAFDASSGGVDYGDSFLKLTPGLGVNSYFTPTDEASDFANDQDFGSGGSAMVLNVNAGALKHLVVGGGKDGSLFVVNGDGLGGLGNGNARQTFYTGGPLFATSAFWNNTLYVAPVNAPLVAFTYDPASNLFTTAASSQSTSLYGFPGATPSISATGTSNGIVWALDNTNYCTPQSPACGATVLHAYNATSLSTDLWNSGMAAADTAGYAVKFTVPTVANGKVYVGTRGNNIGGNSGSTSSDGRLEVYGLKTD